MTVICEKTCCNESVLLLPMQADASIGDDDFALLMGYTVESEITEYHVSEGAEYVVYGILVYKNQIRYLIQDNDGIQQVSIQGICQLHRILPKPLRFFV